MLHAHFVRENKARFALGALLLVPAACGGGGSGGGGGPPAGAPANHAESLAGLGVDMTFVPRVDEHGNPLPDDYAPLGNVHRMDPITELWFAGVRVGANGPVARLVEDVSALTPNGQGFVTPTALHDLPQASAPWMLEAGAEGQFARSLRDAAAIDVDGDGGEELVVVHFENQRLFATVVRKDGAGYSTSNEAFLFNLPAVVDVDVVGGDFDGDGDGELAVGYATALDAWLRVFEWDVDRFVASPGASELFHRQFSNGQLELVLASGRLDHDLADELVVVVNERTSTATTTSYRVLDDLDAGFPEIQSGLVAAFNPTQGVVVAAVANVALGDVDGDQLDEIVFGGLEFLTDSCDDGVPYVAIVLDDAAADFAAIGARAFEANYPGCDAVDEYQLVFPQVNVLDLDGDGLGEMQVDRFLFDDLANAASPFAFVTAWNLPPELFLQEDLESWVDSSNLASAVGDFDADGRDEVLHWRPQRNEIVVYGLNEGSSSVTRSARIAVAGGTQRFPNPLLVAVDTDRDAPILVSVPVGEEQEPSPLTSGDAPAAAGDGRRGTFLFHEPLVLAVLAAPPAKFGIEQNTEACTTTFGNTASSGDEEELSVSFKSSFSVGFKVMGGALTQSEVEAKATISREVEVFATRSYDVSKTVSFTTGANEDTVVFTTTPMDQYVYRFLHHPVTAMIGRELVITLPREPVTLQVERAYYNAHVAPGGVRVDDTVFRHVIGDPSTYPTAQEKDDLLAQHGGEELGPQAVGQGSGSTELEIEIAEEYAVGGSLTLGFDIEAEVTAGTILAGGSVGAEASATFQVTSGASTTYTGAVGSIGAGDFAEHRYSFGLFTYVHRDAATGQEFEVVDYWVE